MSNYESFVEYGYRNSDGETVGENDLVFPLDPQRGWTRMGRTWKSSIWLPAPPKA